MGTGCSCGNSRPCGGGAEEGPPAPAEYEPAKGAGEEDETLRREDFNHSAQTRPHGALHAAPDARDLHAGFTDLGSLSHADTGFLVAALEDENNEKKDALQAAYMPAAAQVEVEKARALTELRQLLTRSGVDPVEIEQAMEVARRMEATEHDLDEARSRLEVIRVERAMNQATAAAELATAASRGFEEKLPTESEMLQRDRARQEEEAAKLAEASALLHLAKADKDIGKLKEAISRAEIDGVEEAELQEARQVLADLEKKGGKKKGGCLCGGRGGGDGTEKPKKEKKEKVDKKAEKAEKASKKDKADKNK